MTTGRMLYVSPMSMTDDNGMMQRQHQWLQTLCAAYPGQVDFLGLSGSPASARAWFAARGLDVTVLDGPFARMARVNATAWYYGGAVLCNKLRWASRFRFPVRTPLPQAWLSRYRTIVCYYAWNYHLLGLRRAGARVLVDLGDILADRHERVGARRWISLAREDELAVLTSPARCVAISDGDAQEFNRLYGVDLPLVPFVPPNAEALLSLDTTASSRCIGFIGAPSYLNEEILKLLAHEEFLAALRQAQVSLLVAGGICRTADPGLLDRLRAGGARVLGRVDDTRDFYAATTIILNPVGPSTGVKIKSVEALMAGRGLVTTRWGSDATLEQAFPGLITAIDWPVSAAALASACIQLIDRPAATRGGSGLAYRSGAEAAMLRHLQA
jgi:hypothetical protein